ncbi:ribosome-releasing factor 2, mitochondrial [Bacillus rossius redtenbacheri]|uniref:ribosome-releasing factor 2, mitochondrial n=1 Tax=Bacillus rossius redtenbacheri TaxID=93214 RepID=UPI002FDCC1DF
MRRVRNLCVLAHVDAGKTTTTERMLYYAGATRAMGEVHRGNTVTDHLEQERRRGITIASAAVTLAWRGHRLNLLDTPGHVDFTAEVGQALAAADGVVVVLDGSAGVEAQTVTVWRQAAARALPRLVYVNKMDRRDADLAASVHSLQARLDLPALQLQRPVLDGGLKAIVDLVALEKLAWDPDTQGKRYSAEKLCPREHGGLWEDALRARAALVDALADADDDLAELVIREESVDGVPAEAIVQATRRVTGKCAGVPVLCGSSYKNIGVQPLLDAVVRYLPSPDERNTELQRAFGDQLCARAFKVAHDDQRRAVTYLRLFSGRLTKGRRLYNVSQDNSEVAGKVMEPHADSGEEVDCVEAGGIAAVAGLRWAATGDLLAASAAAAAAARSALQSDLGEEAARRLLANPWSAPAPVFFCAVEPESQAQQAALERALEQLRREDPSLRVRADQDTGQTVLGGMGELHLEVVRGRLQSEHGLQVELGALQIAYKEALAGEARDTLAVRQRIAAGTHAVTLELSVRPLEQGEGEGELVRLDRGPDSAANTAAVRPRSLAAVRRGVEAALARGPRLGCPVAAAAVTLHWFEATRGTADTVVTAAAARLAGRLLREAGTRLLEPVMLLEAALPAEDEAGARAVMADLGRRRARVQGAAAARGGARVVSALVPLAELLGYSRDLRTFTSGAASFTLQLHGYERMAAHDEARAVKAVTGLDEA